MLFLPAIEGVRRIAFNRFCWEPGPQGGIGPRPLALKLGRVPLNALQSPAFLHQRILKAALRPRKRHVLTLQVVSILGRHKNGVT